MRHLNVSIETIVSIAYLSLVPIGCVGTTGVTQLLQGEAGQQVTVKAADQTPPSGITLETQGRPGGEVTLAVGAAPMTITIGRGDSYILRAVAEDVDGVKEVAIWGTSEKVCEDPATNTASAPGPGLSGVPIVKDMSSATAGGTATSKRYVSYVVKVDATCPSTRRFVSQTLTLFGEATNFSNLRSKGPSLTVTAH